MGGKNGGWNIRRTQPQRASVAGFPATMVFSCLLIALIGAGCTASQHRRAADKDVYRIIGQGQKRALGKTNEFTIETVYSKRDPFEIKAREIIDDRLAEGKRKLSLNDALKLAVEGNRQYQLRKETLYLTALTLTRERYEFSPQFDAGTTASLDRESNGDRRGTLDSRVGVDQFLKTGGRLGAAVANDLVRYFTGNPRREAVSLLSMNLVQPLLRGAGASVAAENLTQAERNVIYEVRGFTQFQRDFAVEIVTDYFRILQQKDAVRNGYDNYKRAVISRERAEARSFDRGSKLESDQALQQELSAKSSYISAVKAYKDQIDQFKIKLGLTLSVDIVLDDDELKALEKVGAIPLALDEKGGYRLAVENQLELLNEIDRFEDSQRRIKVAANQLRADLNILADASLESTRPTDYTRFDVDTYRAGVGLQLNLPIDRLRERNSYRTALISFERQLRTLSLALDNNRNNILEGLRNLERLRRNYEIQLEARQVADRRVESTTLLFDAGRVVIRDLLEAQSAQVQAQNAVTRTLVDYLVARMSLLLDIGFLDTNVEQFWLKNQPVPASGLPAVTADTTTAVDEVVPPDKLFGTQ